MSLHSDVGYETGVYRVTRRSRGARVEGHYVHPADLDRDVSAIDHVLDTLTMVGHSLVTGAGPFWSTTTDTLPDPLEIDTPYWVIVLDPDTLQLATSRENALALVPIALGDAGVGTMHLANWFTMSADIQPVTGLALDDAREGQSGTEQRTAFTDTRLYIRTALYEPDTVTIDDEEWRVEKVEHFAVISNHFRVTLARGETP